MVAFGDGQNEIHATRVTQAGGRWKTIELHCDIEEGEKVLASIALVAVRCRVRKVTRIKELTVTRQDLAQ
jgi:hypothetical protein